MQDEGIALLCPAPSSSADGSTPLVTALLRKARVAGRLNCGTPIVDPQSREVIGYEIDPIVVAAT